MRIRKRERKKRILTAVFLAGSMLLTACGKTGGKEVLEIQKDGYEKNSYNTVTVMRGDLEPVLTLTLKIENFERINYSVTQQELEVEKVHVSVGDRVKAGDVLVTFKAEGTEEIIETCNTEIEEKQLLIEHYGKLMDLDPETDYKEDIEMLKEDIRIANLYISEAEERLKNYRITAEKSGTITYVSELLAGDFVLANTSLITEACGSGGYTTVTEDDYEWKEGEVFEAVSGAASYDMKLVEVLPEEKDGQTVYTLRFEPESDMTAISEQEQPTITIRKEIQKNVVYVKKGAIRDADGKPYVYVLDENGYRDAVFVTVGDEVDGFLIITEGLSGGEKVTVN